MCPHPRQTGTGSLSSASAAIYKHLFSQNPIWCANAILNHGQTFVQLSKNEASALWRAESGRSQKSRVAPDLDSPGVSPVWSCAGRRRGIHFGWHMGDACWACRRPHQGLQENMEGPWQGARPSWAMWNTNRKQQFAVPRNSIKPIKGFTGPGKGYPFGQHHCQVFPFQNHRAVRTREAFRGIFCNGKLGVTQVLPLY